jgi:para-aminobenzoate synthetase component I
MLSWASQFNICCFLDNHDYNMAPHSYECLLGAGAKHVVEAKAGNAFQALKQFSLQRQDWLFGHFAYDLKNETEQLTSSNPDNIGFADMLFYVPEIVIQLSKDALTISCINQEPQTVFEEICNAPAEKDRAMADININSRFTRQEYLDVIQDLRRHILRGDCYEINFCQEFFAEDSIIHPLQVYTKLTAVSPNPFTAFYKNNDKYLLCASPERYLKKTGSKILSQPIKGTGDRDTNNALLDHQKKQQLLHSAKDRAENVMIVDLVRNDLSRICEASSVRVDELFGIYTFPQVHQMISTVSGQLKKELHWIDAICATFPMGSMTGAPKKKVMELIENYERTRRGIFSGAVGYVTPDADFDFNVVIRSILYNASARYLSYQVGSAITFYSQPANEYEECMLKASAIRNSLSNNRKNL